MIEAERHIYIATPSYDNCCHVQYHCSVIATWHVLEPQGMTLTCGHPSQDALMSRVRASLVNNFLSSPEFTHLMWIDSDLGWDAHDIVRLLATGKDIVGGVYRKRTDEAMTFPVVLLDDGATELDETGCFEVKYLPGGFCLMTRAAILRMIARYPESRCMLRDGGWQHQDNAYAYDLFATMIDDTGVLLSEDYSFFKRWRAIGGKCWCLPSIRLAHIGKKPFIGRLSDHLPELAAKESSNA